MKELLRTNRYLLLLVAISNLLMIPVWERKMTISASLIVVMSYSLIIFTGINITDRKINKLWLIIIGTFTLICVWIEFALGWSEMISMIRIISTLILFISLFYSLIIEIISTKDICVEMILAVMSGFLFLGCLLYTSPSPRDS